MKIIVETIPIKSMRYNTVGDWMIDADKNELRIFVADMNDQFKEYLLARHEMDEAMLCLKSGVSQKMVDEFDMVWETSERVNLFEEPGIDPDAPYHNQHMVAYGHEILMAQSLGIDWTDYNNEIEELSMSYNIKEKE